MKKQTALPNAKGQLVWNPNDPSLGIGVITNLLGKKLAVKFLRLQEERFYSTQNIQDALLRYQISHGEAVEDKSGNRYLVKKYLKMQEDGLAVYELDNGALVVESDLLPNIKNVGAKDKLAMLRLSHPEAVRARLEGLDLTRSMARAGHAAILGARAQWLPHQIDIATQALHSDPVRLLLADEVGLGKTVEAALIYAALRYEGRADRVLILTPSSLSIQWLGEIYRKTHHLPVLLDKERLADTRRDFADLNPFEVHHQVVVPISLLFEDDLVYSALELSNWDLIIVDEVHHFQWSNDLQDKKAAQNHPYNLLKKLAQQTKHLLLLTATPMALNAAAYQAILCLLDANRFDSPEKYQKTLQRAAQLKTCSKAILQAVRNHSELEDSQAIENLLEDDEEDSQTLQQFQQSKKMSPERVALAQKLLEALRDRHATADYVIRNRRGPVGNLPKRQAKIFALQASPSQEALIEAGEAIIMELVESSDQPEAAKYRMLGEMFRALWATPRALLDIVKPYSRELMVELAPYVSQVVDAPLNAQGEPSEDRRLQWLLATLRALEKQEKVLVFVESATAIRALRDSLLPLWGREIAIFHRDLEPRDQDRQVAYFRDPQGPQIMLSTEAGGEGRNFQFCHHVILYDLPWRPGTVEQRIGRVDRVGQKNDVQIWVPYYKGSFEAAVVKVMQQSIGVLQHTVGGIDHALEAIEEKISKIILSQQGPEAWQDLFDSTQESVQEALQKLSNDEDPILDLSSFSAKRVQHFLDHLPVHLEHRLQYFIQRYAHYQHLELHPRQQQRFAIEGAPSSAGPITEDSGYIATFSRQDALDHEDIQFLSYGHPLVEQALEWAEQAEDISTAIAMCRGMPYDGAIFLWTYGLCMPEHIKQAKAYIQAPLLTFALNEAGRPQAEFDDILQRNEQPLEKMDIKPLLRNKEHWQKLVNSNHLAAESIAHGHMQEILEASQQQLKANYEQRFRRLKRQHLRSLTDSNHPEEKKQQHKIYYEQQFLLEKECQEGLTALQLTRPKLISVIAIKLIKKT